MKTGTLKELNVKPGDVVECLEHWYSVEDAYTVGQRYTVDEYGAVTGKDGATGISAEWRIITRAPDKPKLWRDMTDEEKGALLLAYHEGKVIEWNAKSVVTGKWGIWDKCGGDCLWDGIFAYRVKPEPVQETVEMLGFIHNHEWYYRSRNDARATHRITFKTVDGKPDCSTIKMEETEE